MFVFLGLFLLGIDGCRDRGDISDEGPDAGRDGGPVDIWSIQSAPVETVRFISRLSVESADTIGASALGYEGVPRGFVAADSRGFIVSDIGFATPRPEARAYGWDLDPQWTFVDSSPPAPFHPFLGRACMYADSQALLSTSAGGGMLYLLDREDGALEGTIVLSGILPDSGSGESAQGSPVAGSLSISGETILAGWSYASFDGVDCSVSLLDRSGGEMVSFSRPSGQDDMAAQECRTALIGGYCAVALPSEDLIVLVDTCGEVARTITCGHMAARPFLTPSAAGPNISVVNPVIADMQAGIDERLWVLFGPGAFPTDSSELWAIDLESMEASVLPLSSLATGFGVWGDRAVVQTRGRDRNMETDSWSDPENRVLVMQLEEGV